MLFGQDLENPGDLRQELRQVRRDIARLRGILAELPPDHSELVNFTRELQAREARRDAIGVQLAILSEQIPQPLAREASSANPDGR